MFEYKMSKNTFDAIAKTRKNKKSNPYDYVKEVINSEFGIKGVCIKVIVE